MMSTNCITSTRLKFMPGPVEFENCAPTRLYSKLEMMSEPNEKAVGDKSDATTFAVTATKEYQLTVI